MIYRKLPDALDKEPNALYRTRGPVTFRGMGGVSCGMLPPTVNILRAFFGDLVRQCFNDHQSIPAKTMVGSRRAEALISWTSETLKF